MSSTTLEEITERLRTMSRNECTGVMFAAQARIGDLNREKTVASRPASGVQLTAFIDWIIPDEWEKPLSEDVATVLLKDKECDSYASRAFTDEQVATAVQEVIETWNYVQAFDLESLSSTMWDRLMDADFAPDFRVLITELGAVGTTNEPSRRDTRRTR